MTHSATQPVEMAPVPHEPGVGVYGALWCGDCRRAKAVLDRLDVGYQWHDVASDEQAAADAVAISGRRSIPVITFPDGSHLVEPSNPALLEALVRHGVISA